MGTISIGAESAAVWLLVYIRGIEWTLSGQFFTDQQMSKLCYHSQLPAISHIKLMLILHKVFLEISGHFLSIQVVICTFLGGSI